MDSQFNSEKIADIRQRLSEWLIDPSMLDAHQLSVLDHALNDPDFDFDTLGNTFEGISVLLSFFEARQEQSELFSKAISSSDNLLKIAQSYAASLSLRLLKFDFSPIDPKESALEYYEMIEASASELDALASCAMGASELYEMGCDAVEAITTLLCDQRLMQIGKAISNNDQDGREISDMLTDIKNSVEEYMHLLGSVMSLVSDVSEVYGQYARDSEPLIMDKAQSIGALSRTAEKYTSSLYTIIQRYKSKETYYEKLND